MEREGEAEESGKFSQDPTFDPGELFDVIERDESGTHVLEAMRQFLLRSDASMFERAVAVYVRSARARKEPVETVLAALEAIADELERDSAPGFKQRETPLRQLVLRGVLLAFYGADVVQREATAREERVERRQRSRDQGPQRPPP
jgi:hypothetical protein